MAVNIDHRRLINKLKKEVTQLQRKEKATKTKLRSALKKIRKQARSYKTKLAAKVRAMQIKAGQAQSSTYLQVADDIERQLMNNLAAKGKSLSAAIHKFEKQFIDKLTQKLAKKGRQSSKSSRKRKTKSAKPVSTLKLKKRRVAKSRARKK